MDIWLGCGWRTRFWSLISLLYKHKGVDFLLQKFREAFRKKNSEYNENGTKGGGNVWPESLFKTALKLWKEGGAKRKRNPLRTER